MAGIDDLKNDGKTVRPFIPTADVEDDPNDRPMYQNKGSVLSMTSGKSVERPTTETRTKADLSGLPQDEKESLGVDVRESITKDILGPGGIFHEYVAKQKQEMGEYLENQELEAEIGDSPVNTEKTEEEELLGEDTVVTPKNESYKEIDIMAGVSAPEEKEDSAMESNETNMPSIAVPEHTEVTGAAPMEVQNGFIAEPEVSTESVETPIETSTSSEEDKSVGLGDEDGIIIGREMVEDTTTTDEEESDEFDTEVSDSEVDDTTEEQKLELLKSMVTEKLKPISSRMSLAGFTVAKKGTISSSILNTPKEVPVAKWVLPTTGIIVKMKEILGSDLEKIRYSMSNNDARTALQIIYANIVTAKPATFEAWVKSVAFEDYDHLFMAIYIASFTDSNYIPIDCTNPLCKKKTYLTDNMPIMDMVKFKDDAAKAKWMKLYQSETVEGKGLYPTEIVPISESFAVGFVEPSIYSVMIETSYIDDAFADKHRNTISMIPFIDQIYQIDQVNKSLIPVEWKTFTNNIAKSVKSRVVRYEKILDTMNADEIAVLRAFINEINNKNEGMVSYQIPETTCPHCEHVNAATPNQTASSLVFLRNQLGLLVTT